MTQIRTAVLHTNVKRLRRENRRMAACVQRRTLSVFT